MKRVVIESPYAGDIERNVEYARAAMKDSLSRGEAPLASHLLYTQPGILDDSIFEEREKGIAAGILWSEHAEATIFYTDLGWSEGMKNAKWYAEQERRPIETRTIPGWLASRG